ncbi:MAG: oligosaccharide flippase family protein [Candidatus Thorarchaeota archaeon]
MNEKFEDHKYFTTSLIFLFLAQIMSLLIRMGSRIIIARFSSPDIYGLYSVIWNEMTLVSTIALIGLGQQLTIDLPRENNKEKKRSALTAVVYALIVGLILCCISIVLLIINIESTYKYSLLIASVFIVFLFVQSIFIGMKDFLGYFIQSVSQNLFFLITIVIVRQFLTIEIMMYILLSSIVFSIIVSAIYLLIKTKISIRSIFSIKIKLFVFSSKRANLFLVDVINSIIFYFLLKIPQIILGNSFAGFINIAYSLMVFLIIPPQMIALALGPKLSLDFHESKWDKLQNSYKMALSILYIFQGIVIIIFSYFGDVFIELLYGHEYLVGSRIIFYGFLFAAIIDSFNYQYAIFIRNTDNEKLFALGKIISLIAFIVPEITLLFVLSDYVMVAVPVAYLISTFSLLVFYFFYNIKLNEKYEKKDLRIFLMWLLFIFSNYILALITVHYLHNKLYVLAVALVNVLIFIFYLMISKTINIKKIIHDLKEMFSLIRNKNENNQITE